MDEENKAPDASEQEVAEETTQETPEVDTAAELAKAKEIADNYKKRAEKAEAKLKEKETPKNEAPAPSQDSLSTKDILALTENKVSSEDYDEVLRMAKILGKPVHEALKDKALKVVLDTRAEERRTEAATHARGGARGTAKTSGEDILRRAETRGELPDTDEGIKALAEARIARLKAQARN